MRLFFKISIYFLLLSGCAPAALQPYPIAPSYPGSNPAPIGAPTGTRAPAPIAERVQHTGTLTGRVSIGPLSPIQSVGVIPPPIPPEVYATRTIQIFGADGATLVTNVKIYPDGTYTVTLPLGSYSVNIARTGIDRARGLPKTITIENGKAVQLDIDIDTGIR